MKKALSLVLSLVLAFSCLPAALAARFADEAKWPASASWAKEEINYMVEKGVLNGFAEDNTFRPADPVTRVQFIKMIDETFGLTATTAINYSDVKSDLWFYPYVQKAAAQGYLLNYGSALNPNGQLTRQEAAALLARYLDLDPTQKVPSSTYKDYSSIKTAYREYVLQASYVGLFQGDEDGKFSPDRILKRCEAAAILYRAAGTIYRATATGTDAGAGDKNAVISKSGITVTGANVDGQMIITEGAAGGTVTIRDSVIDTLEIRGTAAVVLYGCFVDEIIVDSSAVSKISLFTGCDIGSVTAETPVEMNVSSDSTVDSLNVEKNAKNSAVSGSGTVTEINVNAAGFTSARIPAKYTIGTGISATFAGKVYNGAGAEFAAQGLTEQASTYATTADVYLKAKPAVSGTLYYYFTNTAEAPTAAAYNGYYTSASVKSSLSVTANAAVDKKLSTAASVTGYNYVVIMISGCQPVVLSNAASTGFSITPVVNSDINYDLITYQAAVNGKLYYYYTNTSSVPATSAFATTYNASSTIYKGKLDAVANQLTTLDTVIASVVSSYKYVVVQLADAAGNLYQPVVVTRNAAASSTGFSTAPTCELESTNVAVKMIAATAGTVEYYYTTSPNVPTSEQFTANYGAVSSDISGAFIVSQNSLFKAQLPNQDMVRRYTYVVFRLTSVAGTSYQPAIAAIPAGAGLDLTGSGFAKAPYTSVAGGYYSLNIQATQTGGTLYYYLTDYPEAPAASTFDMNYEAAVTGTQLASKNGGAVTITTATSQAIKTAITTAQASNFGYMVLCIKFANTNMKPIIIPIVGGSDEAAMSATTGFRVNPVYTKTTERTHEISFTTSVNGVVYYYYSDSSAVPTDYKTVLDNVAAEINTGFGGVTNAPANQKVSMPISGIFQIVLPYVVLMVQDADGTYYKPVVIPTDANTSSAVAAGFAETPTVTTPTAGMSNLTYKAQVAGTIFYYFAAVPTPPDAATFTTNWMTSNSAGRGGSITVTPATLSGAKTLNVPSGYSYLVLMMQTSDSSRQPIVVSLYGGAAAGSSTGFSGTPYVYNNTLYFTPVVTGTLYYYMTNDTGFSMSGLAGIVNGMNGGTYSITSTSMKSIPLAAGAAYGFQNIIVWIMDSTGTMLESVVVPMSGTSVPGMGTTTGNGFTTAPQLMGNWIVFTPAAAGTVKYFFTNSEQTYTAYTFAAGFSGTGANASGTQSVLPFSSSMPSINIVPSYKYVWIQIDSFTPVRVQIY